ncbi:hypothetical protein [Alcanivorax sp.]|uniref:hypothetical protein n=1 Tax=Alcanivorax sp. TaxID=1872427 RepID=UPI0025B995C8|nr:hypothetical protein [Alcanivorax sp.]
MPTPTIDRYTPEIPRLAAALNIDEKHISFSKYKPMVVSVDTPTLIIPVTKPEHVLAASLNAERWADLFGGVYMLPAIALADQPLRTQEIA